MVQFEWDPAKDKANQDKHGISFAEAQFAFADPHRVIAETLSTAKSKSASIASAWSKAACSRFDSRTADEVIRIIGAGYWRRGKAIYEQEN